MSSLFTNLLFLHGHITDPELARRLADADTQATPHWQARTHAQCDGHGSQGSGTAQARPRRLRLRGGAGLNSRRLALELSGGELHIDGGADGVRGRTFGNAVVTTSYHPTMLRNIEVGQQARLQRNGQRAVFTGLEEHL